ncbi:uncharacterized protein [Anabrus simplex]|uniref:uncharacterized protein n=1 Tax=Anabrus simplex TaxID=316456 RepID=UPI0035A392C1
MTNMYINSDVGHIHEGNKPKLELTDCSVCGQNHDTESCPFLSKLQPVQDSKTPSRARLTLPANLEVEDKPDGRTAVIARAVFARGTRFGPFHAARVPVLPTSTEFPLKVFGKTDEDSYYLDTSNEEACNWMCLVAPGTSAEDQNLICYQMNQDIYYCVMKDIQPDEELRVWYAPYYAVKMGSMPFSVELCADDTLEPSPESPVDPLDVEDQEEEEYKEGKQVKSKRKYNKAQTGSYCSSKILLVDQQLTQRVAERLPPTKLGAQYVTDKWRCRECGAVETSVIAYARHLMGHFRLAASSAENPFRCHICRKKFSSEVLLVKHKVIRHNIVVQRPRLLANVGEEEGDSPSSDDDSSAESENSSSDLDQPASTTATSAAVASCREDASLIPPASCPGAEDSGRLIVVDLRKAVNVDLQDVLSSVPNKIQNFCDVGTSPGPEESRTDGGSLMEQNSSRSQQESQTRSGDKVPFPNRDVLNTNTVKMSEIVKCVDQCKTTVVQGNAAGGIAAASSSGGKWFDSAMESSLQFSSGCKPPSQETRAEPTEVSVPGTSCASTQVNWCVPENQILNILDSGRPSQISQSLPTAVASWCADQSRITPVENINISANDILLSENGHVSSPTPIDWSVNDDTLPDNNSVTNNSIPDISLSEDMLPTPSCISASAALGWCMGTNLPVTSVANSTSGTTPTESQQVMVSSAVLPQIDWYVEKRDSSDSIITTPVPRVSWLTDETQSSGDSTIEEVARSTGWGTDKSMRAEDGIISRTNDISLLEPEDVSVPSPLEWCSKALESEPTVIRNGNNDGHNNIDNISRKDDDTVNVIHSSQEIGMNWRSSTGTTHLPTLRMDWDIERNSGAVVNKKEEKPQPPVSSLWTAEYILRNECNSSSSPIPSGLSWSVDKSNNVKEQLRGSDGVQTKNMVQDEDSLMSFILPNLIEERTKTIPVQEACNLHLENVSDRKCNEGITDPSLSVLKSNTLNTSTSPSSSSSSSSPSSSSSTHDTDDTPDIPIANLGISSIQDQVAQLRDGEELVFVTGEGQVLPNSSGDHDGQKVAIDALLEQLQQSSDDGDISEKSIPDNCSQLEEDLGTNTKNNFVESERNLESNVKVELPGEQGQYVVIPVPSSNEPNEDQSAGKTVLSQQVFTRLAGDNDLEDVKSLLSKGYSLQFLVEQEDGSTTLVDVVPSVSDMSDVVNQENPQVVVNFDVSSMPLGRSGISNFSIDPVPSDSAGALQIMPGLCTDLAKGVNGDFHLKSDNLNWGALSSPAANTPPDLPSNKTARSPQAGLLLGEATGVLNSLIDQSNQMSVGKPQQESNLDFGLDIPLSAELGKQLECPSQTSFLETEPATQDCGKDTALSIAVKTNTNAAVSTEDNSEVNNIGQFIEECKKHLSSLSGESVGFSFGEPNVSPAPLENGRGDFSMDSICSEVNFQPVQKDFTDLLLSQDDSSRALIAVKDFTDLVEVDAADKGFQALSVTPEPPAVPAQGLMLSTPTHSLHAPLDGRMTPLTTEPPRDNNKEGSSVMTVPTSAISQSLEEQQTEAEAADIDLEMLVEEVDDGLVPQVDAGPPYSCDICNKEFLKALYLYRHLRKHTGEFTCVRCLAVFARKENLLSHACFASNGAVTCEHCGKRFLHKKLLTRHMAIHTGKWTCRQCECVFPSRSKLDLHQQDHHSADGNMQLGHCHLCGLKFLSIYAKRRHRCISRRRKCRHCGRFLLAPVVDIIHRHERYCYEVKTLAQGRPALCPECGARFSQLVLYRLHVYKHTHPHTCNQCHRSFRSENEKSVHTCDDKKLNSCLKCPSSFVTLRQLERHNVSHGIPEFHCFECGHSFHEEENLSNHLCQEPAMFPILQDEADRKRRVPMVGPRRVRKKKKEETDDSTEAPAKPQGPLVCEVCGEVYKTPYSLRSHMLLHGERRFKCSLCGKKFHRKDVLQEHLYVHQNPQMPCPICDKKLKSKKSLDIHMLLHTGEKKFVCSVCGKSFYQKVNLRKHERSHNPEQVKPLNCPHCPKTFLSQDYLSKHVLEHTQGRIFQCNLCEKAFVKESTLKTHVRDMHSGQIFPCPVCRDVLKHRSTYKRHMEKLHPEYNLNDFVTSSNSVDSETTQDAEVLLTVSELQLTTSGVQQLQDTQVYDATVPVENAFILVDGAQQPSLEDMVFYVLEPGEEEPAGGLPALDECTV